MSWRDGVRNLLGEVERLPEHADELRPSYGLDLEIAEHQTLLRKTACPPIDESIGEIRTVFERNREDKAQTCHRLTILGVAC